MISGGYKSGKFLYTFMPEVATGRMFTGFAAGVKKPAPLAKVLFRSFIWKGLLTLI